MNLLSFVRKVFNGILKSKKSSSTDYLLLQPTIFEKLPLHTLKYCFHWKVSKLKEICCINTIRLVRVSFMITLSFKCFIVDKVNFLLLSKETLKTKLTTIFRI